jgi:acetolactate synthase-1/2/3 large subunit
MAGNLAVSKADFILILGSRMGIRQIGHDVEFAPDAYKVIVDIDKHEILKPALGVTLPIVAHLDAFLSVCAEILPEPIADMRYHFGQWMTQCLEWGQEYPVVSPLSSAEHPINPYYFIKTLFNELRDDDIIVTGNGSACVMTFQAAELKRGQRLYSNGGSASMGWALPAAIGAARGGGGRRVICIDGDGSLQMNVQELATVAHEGLDIKIFVLDNNGYHSIRQTQDRHFPFHRVGIDYDTGVWFPDLECLADAYGLAYRWFYPERLTNILESHGPVLCQVNVSQQSFSPVFNDPSHVEEE